MTQFRTRPDGTVYPIKRRHVTYTTKEEHYFDCPNCQTLISDDDPNAPPLVTDDCDISGFKEYGNFEKLEPVSIESGSTGKCPNCGTHILIE